MTIIPRNLLAAAAQILTEGTTSKFKVGDHVTIISSGVVGKITGISRDGEQIDIKANDGSQEVTMTPRRIKLFEEVVVEEEATLEEAYRTKKPEVNKVMAKIDLFDAEELEDFMFSMKSAYTELAVDFDDNPMYKKLAELFGKAAKVVQDREGN